MSQTTNTTSPIKKTSLFELTTDRLEIDEILGMFDGEITDEDQEAKFDAFLAEAEKNTEAFKRKIDNCVFLRDELRGSALVKKTKGNELIDAARRDDKNADKLEQRVEQAITRLAVAKNGEEKYDEYTFDSNYHKLKFVGSGGTPAVIYDFEDIATIPKAFITKRPELNKSLVLEKLKAGIKLSFAKFAEKKKKLKIS
jgi:hypothetical protein